MNTRARLKRLEAAGIGGALFVFREGDELTPEQAADVAAAEARGRKVMIYDWKTSAIDPNKFVDDLKNAPDAELREIISNATKGCPELRRHEEQGAAKKTAILTDEEKKLEV